MITEIYVSTNGLDFTRLDLMKAESINFKYVYKDTQDLSKVYSPYSQSFALEGSLNNLRALGFIGDTSVIKEGKVNNFDCKIYINGLLSKQGLLKVTELREEFGKVKSITANFTNNLLDLKTRMGETLVSELPETDVLIEWSAGNVFNLVRDGYSTPVNHFVPLISNNRVFTVDLPNINNPLILDNVIYNPTANPNSDKVISINELAPAVQFKTIIDLIKDKYALNIEMPLEQESWYNDLYIYCNKQSDGSFNNEAYYDVINNFSQTKNDFTGDKYQITSNNFTNEFTINNNNGINGDYCVFDMAFYNIQNLKNNEDITIEWIFERVSDGAVLFNQSKTIPNGASGENDIFIMNDADFGLSNEIKFKAKIKTSTPISWTGSDVQLHSYYFSLFGTKTNAYTSYNNNSSTMGFNKINLYKSIPNIKVFDFLTSFLKMFNISIFESNPEDGKLYFLTPKDINAENKIYSKKEVDYTAYVTENKVTKKIASEYNYYTLKHKDSKWRNPNNYGNLSYPTIKPTSDLKEFKVETNFTIQQSVPIAGLSVDFPTMYGFTNESPELLDNGALRYKPNTEDLLIFFKNGDMPFDYSVGWKLEANNGSYYIRVLNSYKKVGSVHEATGFSLGFSLIESAINESLYENYYADQIERLLNPNSLQHTFQLELPPNELILNFANDNQGESNIPNGFRLQNDIIIQEKKYSIIDATIDQTTGKTTITLLNYA